MPPGEKNAKDSQIAASATFTVLKNPACGFRACAIPKPRARTSIAATGPSASASRRSGRPRNVSSSHRAAKINAQPSGAACAAQRDQSGVSCTRAPLPRNASAIASAAITAPSVAPLTSRCVIPSVVCQPSWSQERFASRTPTSQVANPKESPRLRAFTARDQGEGSATRMNRSRRSEPPKPTSAKTVTPARARPRRRSRS